MNNPFSWEYMTTAPGTDDVLDIFGIVCLVIFGVGFLVSVLLFNDRAKRFVQHPLKRRLLRRAGGIGTAVFGAGLFFFGIRALQINPFTFGLSIWLWLCLLAALVMVGYFWYYARRVYPNELRAYEQHQIKHRDLRPATAGTADGLGPMPRHGARPAPCRLA